MIMSNLREIININPDAARRWLKITRLIWLGGMVIAVLGSLLPFTGLNDSGFGLDAILHFLLYGFLSFTPLVTIRDRKKAFLIGISMAPLGYILEMTQNFSPVREFSAVDLLSNNLGAIVGLGAGTAIRFGLMIFRSREKDLSIRENLSEKSGNL
jgi:VanZ family protein